ncbi:hypothetical protein M407DRAFT_27830 [Tulasnella calospora MUT 4182]|uniref:Uncharacterized protein n=1 Tax=Tulasnella calospora MUT 4182 TaxID=1051891 RepID=A0A0C3LMR2_9AGAM|nr:hypothetical protein M407DRAFT_27830 [Tulasnella calospora MUT 4182]
MFTLCWTSQRREQQQLAALRDKLEKDSAPAANSRNSSTLPTGDIEGGYGEQEDLEDRYATTSGEH